MAPRTRPDDHRLDRLERAVGELAAALHEIGGSARLARTRPDLASLLALHERRLEEAGRTKAVIA
jgi:uncharacterized membrane protein YccC